MKWLTHEVLTGLAIYAVTADGMAAAAGMAGAILPDKVEGSPQSTGWSVWRSRHRGWSHWPLLYVFVGGCLLQLPTRFPAAADRLAELSYLGFFFCVGALLHILEDALCGKVPFILPTQKIGCRLFKVGSVREYLVALLLAALCYLLGAALRAAGWT